MSTEALREVLALVDKVEAMRKQAAAQSEHREWFLSHNHARELAYHLLRDHGDAILAALTGSEGEDAGRYRWLRDAYKRNGAPRVIAMKCTAFGSSYHETTLQGDELDASVDAARQSQQSGQEVGK